MTAKVALNYMMQIKFRTLTTTEVQARQKDVIGVFKRHLSEAMLGSPSLTGQLTNILLSSETPHCTSLKFK